MKAQALLWLGLGLLGAACAPSSKPLVIDSQTNWLQVCSDDAECGTRSCVCGVCTSACTTDAACGNESGSACVDSKERGSVAVCGGNHPPVPGLCLPRCEDGVCPGGQMCVASVCVPEPEARARVSVDTTARHQVLIGFGASTAYAEDELASHPRKAAIYQTVFDDLGLDVVRLRDRYGHTGDDDLTSSRALIDAMKAGIGRTPTILLTSWSPPAALKASGDSECHGNPDTCTLAKTAGGAFDYAGFASYWRKSLDAYTATGIFPDYIGIQNDSNWVPTSAETGEACKFLPVEGTTTVKMAGSTVQVTYPGYAEALSATLDAFSGLATIPKVLAPETVDFASVPDYTSAIDSSSLDAIAHHLYGSDPNTIDLAGLQAIGQLGTALSKPILQTEMQADGFNTAVLMHMSLAVEGAAAYLQASLAGPATGPLANQQALIGVSATDFSIEDPYYAFKHFAYRTDPGWVRVDATSTASEVLASAWLSPDETALTVILINTGSSGSPVELKLDDAWPNSEVTRTVFGGIERYASLGALPSGGVVVVPARSVVTVALSN